MHTNGNACQANVRPTRMRPNNFLRHFNQFPILRMRFVVFEKKARACDHFCFRSFFGHFSWGWKGVLFLHRHLRPPFWKWNLLCSPSDPSALAYVAFIILILQMRTFPCGLFLTYVCTSPYAYACTTRHPRMSDVTVICSVYGRYVKVCGCAKGHFYIKVYEMVRNVVCQNAIFNKWKGLDHELFCYEVCEEVKRARETCRVSLELQASVFL